MNALFSQFQTNPELERNGVRVEYLSDDEEAVGEKPREIHEELMQLNHSAVDLAHRIAENFEGLMA